MTADVLPGATDKPIAANAIASFFSSSPLVDGTLIIGFPNLGGVADEASADALWLSPTRGPVVFDLVEGTELGDFETRQDDLHRLFRSRLLKNRELVSRRGDLRFEVNAVTFAPAVHRGEPSDDDYRLAVGDRLTDVLQTIPEQPLDPELFQQLTSVIQNVNTIRRSRATREANDPDSRGGKLLQLEKSIATLDNMQSHAVIETVDGVQRIRGLAGSGKTVILALKAAYLHGRHPDWRIAVTFYTRSLKEQFIRLITTFCMNESGMEPDWDRIRVVNAWGGSSADRTGIYREFCIVNDAKFWDFQSASARWRDAFRGALAEALSEVENPQPVYDVILVDEAQDFSPEFLRMCYSMLTEERRLVYAYDELQTLSGEGLPSSREIFGLNEDGSPKVSFETRDYDRGARRDIVLEKCYRNSRPVLVTAHALGFGTFREPIGRQDVGLVQMFDHASLWTDIGYEVQGGALIPGQEVTLARTEATSPRFLESHSPLDDLIQFHRFATAKEQNDWVASQIAENLRNDELRSDDIMVINPDPRSARNNLGPLRRILLEDGIDNHLAGVDTSQDVFFARDRASVTFTGIFRAKGNEAGMVYVVNAHEGNINRLNLSAVRNRLFTAITRAKAWVRVCGVGAEMDLLMDEFEKIRAAHYRLRFTYPTEAERQRLRILHREADANDLAEIGETSELARKLISNVRSGKVHGTDLEPEVLDELRALLGDASGT